MIKKFREFTDSLREGDEEDKVKDRHDQEKYDQERRQARELERAKERDFQDDQQARSKEQKQKQIDMLKKEDTNPPEVGTDDIVKRYSKVIPGQ